MITRKRSITAAILSLLVATVVWFAPAPADDAAMLSEHARKTRSQGAVATVAPLVGAARPLTRSANVLAIASRALMQDEDEEDEDRGESSLFAIASWIPKIEKPVPVERAPQKIVATLPALPFRFIGRYDDADRTIIFLQYKNQTLTAQTGDTLIGVYRVESLQGTTLSLRYLPLNQLQTLQVGDL